MDVATHGAKDSYRLTKGVTPFCVKPQGFDWPLLIPIIDSVALIRWYARVCEPQGLAPKR